MPAIFSKDIVIPPSILEAPAKAACPPLLAAKGHFDQRERRTRADTWVALVGVKMQCGRTLACCRDQKEVVNEA